MPPKRMTANPLRPARYRPGKPVGAEHYESSEEEDEEEEEQEDNSEPAKPVVPAPAALVSSALKKVDLNKKFEESRRQEAARKAAEADEQESEGESSEDEGEDDSEESSEEESSEEESEDEKPVPQRVLLRPTFIPKNKRNGAAAATVVGGISVAQRKKEEEAERRKTEAQALVEEHIRQEAEARVAARKGVEDDFTNDASQIDDTDDLDPAVERAAWKLRELSRVKREREALEKVEKEREELEHRRNMNEAERYKEDMEFVKNQREEAKESRGKMGFLQKYYHKGAFYQDDESEVLRRNYATARVEDEAINREVLPKYLQVRGDEVGKRGRTKWSHLAAEDTSKVEGGSPWFDKRLRSLGGMKDDRFLPDSIRERKSGGEHKDSFREKGDWYSDRQDRRNDNYWRGGDHHHRRFNDNDEKRPPNGPKRGHERTQFENTYESGRREGDYEKRRDSRHHRNSQRHNDRDCEKRESGREYDKERKRGPEDRNDAIDKRRRVEAA